MSFRRVSTVIHLEPPLSSPEPHQTCAEMKARQCEKLAELRAALLFSGFDTVSKQAAAIGLSRSSAWKVLKGDHKHSGLSASTIKRMLASPLLPVEARQVIEDYVREKLRGAYGHASKCQKKFHLQLGSGNAPSRLSAP